MRVKSKNVWLCCTPLEEKVEWFYKVVLAARPTKNVCRHPWAVVQKGGETEN